MRERPIGIQELETNPSGCLEEVRSGTTLLLMYRTRFLGHTFALRGMA